MSIPGLDSGPVDPSEESFSFQGSDEDPNAPRPSKYLFADGQYPATAVSIVQAVSQAGNKQFVLTCIGTNGKASGIDYKVFLPIEGKAVWKTEKTLAAFGVAKGAGNAWNFTKADVVGKSCTLDLVAEEYNGKTRMVVKAVFAPTAPATPDNGPIPGF